jgi:hypothetical protein
MTRLYGSVVQEKAISKWHLVNHAGKKKRREKATIIDDDYSYY